MSEAEKILPTDKMIDGLLMAYEIRGLDKKYLGNDLKQLFKERSEDYHKTQMEKKMPSDEEKQEAYRKYQLGEIGNDVYEEGAFLAGIEYLKQLLK